MKYFAVEKQQNCKIPGKIIVGKRVEHLERYPRGWKAGLWTVPTGTQRSKLRPGAGNTGAWWEGGGQPGSPQRTQAHRSAHIVQRSRAVRAPPCMVAAPSVPGGRGGREQQRHSRFGQGVCPESFLCGRLFFWTAAKSLTTRFYLCSLMQAAHRLGGDGQDGCCFPFVGEGARLGAGGATRGPGHQLHRPPHP